MSSLPTCRASWKDGVLTLENALFCRQYVWANERLNSHLFQAFERDWIQKFDASANSAANLPEFSIFEIEAAVGAPRLEIRLENDEVSYEFRLWEGVAGCAFRVQRVANEFQSERQIEAASGIETDAAPNLRAENAMRALERFTLSPQHLRLRAARFHDRTDEHVELLHESEWLLGERERRIELSGNAFALESVFENDGLLFFRHSPEPEANDAPNFRVENGRQITFQDENSWCATIAFEGGILGRCRAVRDYGRALRNFQSERDGLFLSNTWGDRSRDAHLTPEFMAREIEAAARLGVDIVQVDDGWQQGTTANSALAAQRGGVWNGFWASDSQFWNVNRERFSDGLEPLISGAQNEGMKFGLWFAPDSTDDLKNWARDADAILKLHREFGVNFFKIDALKLDSPTSEANARRFFARVLEESNGRVTFDLDITAERRFGYFGLPEAGPLFVENRYTDWGSYFPHLTLRALWKLAHWIEPTRLRFEWLNHARNEDKYKGDPLAPRFWAPDALFASVMLASPLGWFEVQNLPASYFERAAPLIALWKEQRAALRNGVVVPIGDAPDGQSWTGFAVVGEKRSDLLVFRERNSSPTSEFALPFVRGNEMAVLAGDGEIRRDGTRFSVRVEEPFGFLWVKCE